MPFITQGKTNLKYLLILAVLAVIVGGGILGYYYLWLKDLEMRIAEIETRLSVVKQPTKIIEDETANWKVYRNEKYRFEVKYPNNWKLNFESPNIEIASIDRTQYLHGVGVPPKGNAWITFIPSLPKNFSEGKEEIQVGPGDYVIITNREILTSEGQTIGVIKEYWKNDPLASQFEQLFNQILSTFRFLE